MVEVYDIELVKNEETNERFFSYTGIDKDSDKEYQFYIYDSLDGLEEFKKHLKELEGMVGYNCINYDYPLIHIILTTKFHSLDHFFTLLLNKSDDIIQNNAYARLWDNETLILQLDLFLIWHFDNKAKRTSLKDCEMAMRFPNLQSFPSNHPFTKEGIQFMLDYNKNDVQATKQLYLITKGLTNHPLYKDDDKIQLRKDISKEYGIKCINYNDVKIGDEINKLTYLKLSGKKWSDIKNTNTKRDSIKIADYISSEIKFVSKKLNEVLEWFKSKIITGTKGQIEKTFTFNNIKFKIAQGGIHTIDKPDLFIPKEDEILYDIDIDSEYPTSIILLKLFPAHLGITWLTGYTETYDKRIYAKKHRKVENRYATANKALKLALNGGGYGKTGEVKSWQGDPAVMTAVTVNCQLLVLMLCERFYYQEIEILSGNTDGITLRFKKDKLQLVQDIVKQFTEETKYTFEEVEYKLIARTSINDYLAVKLDGSIKLKGDWEIDKEIHKNHSNRIRPIALANYFINHISIEETINNHYYEKEYTFGKDKVIGYGIYDYCLYVKGGYEWAFHLYEKADKLNDFSATKVTLLPKNIRYYISNDGGELHKLEVKGSRDNRQNVGYLVTIANLIEDNNPKNYDINYQFYIDECKKMIDAIEIAPIIKQKSKKRIDNTTKQLMLF
jgi:hypothetical protein